MPPNEKPRRPAVFDPTIVRSLEARITLLETWIEEHAEEGERRKEALLKQQEIQDKFINHTQKHMDFLLDLARHRFNPASYALFPEYYKSLFKPSATEETQPVAFLKLLYAGMGRVHKFVTDNPDTKPSDSPASFYINQARTHIRQAWEEVERKTQAREQDKPVARKDERTKEDEPIETTITPRRKEALKTKDEQSESILDVNVFHSSQNLSKEPDIEQSIVLLNLVRAGLVALLRDRELSGDVKALVMWIETDTASALEKMCRVQTILKGASHD